MRLYSNFTYWKELILIRNGGLARPLTRLSPELQPTRVATGGEYELARGVAREKGRRQKIDSASSGHVYLTLRPVIPAAADLLSRLDARALSFQKRCALQTCPIQFVCFANDEGANYDWPSREKCRSNKLQKFFFRSTIAFISCLLNR